MTRDQIIREEFEAWAMHANLERDQHFPVAYRDPAINAQWLAWQAAWTVAEGYSA